jgi:hypothetical protein
LREIRARVNNKRGRKPLVYCVLESLPRVYRNIKDLKLCGECQMPHVTELESEIGLTTGCIKKLANPLKYNVFRICVIQN